MHKLKEMIRVHLKKKGPNLKLSIKNTIFLKGSDRLKVEKEIEEDIPC